ncbi:DUF4175 domain-containing protein [Sulfidibacter corallicola]|uniref:DUF4175 family protein n=1 Tax=Sulfidibacter corallicola TaxID=2818388 RepID=A0A8A4TEU3_SULCO|nr:DUF4175 family protein [Sulfidibacter corallicola]QTD47734.1 DUF4175 family protein [Sulfidibacter corallicola]
MHPIHLNLSKIGRQLLRQRIARMFVQAFFATAIYLLVYCLAILVIKSMSLTWFGLLWLPVLVGTLLVALLPWQWWRLRNVRQVANFVEDRIPKMALTIHSALDFLEDRSDQSERFLREAYVEQVAKKLSGLNIREQPLIPWNRYGMMALAANVLIWGLFHGAILDKFYNPRVSFGQTHLDLNEGSITIFEPEYTQIPGRTLPLRPGAFRAYPGSRVRFMVQLPSGARELFLDDGVEKPHPLRRSEGNEVTHEFVLLEDTTLRFLVSDSANGGQTQPYQFQVKTDQAPEVLLRGHTPEGMLNVLDPLIIETEIKDDFGIKQLEAVVTWKGGEKRIDIAVPQGRKNHFITRNQWYLSDLGLDKAESFSIYLEAKDNNPINGPGVGRSRELTYELESPERKYDEFMEMARQLLDIMTHTLGDNLDTDLPPQPEKAVLQEAKDLGKSIRNGLYRASDLTNTLITKVRDTPNITRLDQNFLYQYRNKINKRARSRSEMDLLFANVIYNPTVNNSFRRLQGQHMLEERDLEALTYELLLQLKMWAILELERQNNELEDNLDQLQELLDNSENMDSQELAEMFEKLMNEVMKDFQDMIQKAAQQMDMSMEEFMNSDAMQFSEDMMEQLKQQIMEALKEGDIEKAKRLMEQMRQQMQGAMNSMRETMGEMSPEMREMMAQMREFMGLLRELKEREENLERETQALRRELDKQMGGNNAELSEQDQGEHKKIMENIHKMLTELYNRLVDFNSEDLSQQLVEQIAEQRTQLDNSGLSDRQRLEVEQGIRKLEQTLDFIGRNGLDRLQNMTLNGLEHTEKMQDYLDQGELMLSLETGLKLESFLVRGERVADRTVPQEMEDHPRAKDTFQEARRELYEILDALQNLKNQMENRRMQFMQAQNEERQRQLGEKQAKLQEMIEQFQQQAQDSLGGSPLFQKLEDIGLSMKNAERKLDGSRLEGAVQYEQEALQKIGELMEQLQQAQQPNPGSRRPMMGGMQMQRERMQGDPLIKDFYIPDSQKKASRDEMKDAIRKQLQKNLPDAYGKEIRKYYEKLMDQ